MEFDHLDATMLLRVLRDARVEAVAIEYYANPQLFKLIGEIEKIATSGRDKAGDAK